MLLHANSIQSAQISANMDLCTSSNFKGRIRKFIYVCNALILKL